MLGAEITWQLYVERNHEKNIYIHLNLNLRYTIVPGIYNFRKELARI